MLDSDRAADDPTPFELAVGKRRADRYRKGACAPEPADREAIVARIDARIAYAESRGLPRQASIAAAHVAVSRALVKLAKEMSSGRRS